MKRARWNDVQKSTFTDHRAIKMANLAFLNSREE